MSDALGHRVYFSHVANSLAAELTGAFAWTITTYDVNSMYELLGMQGLLQYPVQDVSKPGYYLWDVIQSPAAPPYVVSFFKTNNLLGSGAADTIGRLFTWEKQLVHYFYYQDEPYPDPKLFSYFWPGAPPIAASYIIEGTTYTGPAPPMFAHYTAGCGGTQAFMKSVLRAVNIPVRSRWGVCTHATPVFPTVDLALTHGDDPYDRGGWVSPFQGFPTPGALDYFVTVDQLDQLFPPGQSWEECDHVTGTRPREIAIHFVSDELMKLYCDDLASNASHANGKVYNQGLKWWFPLQTLENAGVWTKLDAKVTATGFCALIK
jgi:hypothetical protein